MLNVRRIQGVNVVCIFKWFRWVSALSLRFFVVQIKFQFYSIRPLTATRKYFINYKKKPVTDVILRNNFFLIHSIESRIESGKCGVYRQQKITIKLKSELNFYENHKSFCCFIHTSTRKKTEMNEHEKVNISIYLCFWVFFSVP